MQGRDLSVGENAIKRLPLMNERQRLGKKAEVKLAEAARIPNSQTREKWKWKLRETIILAFDSRNNNETTSMAVVVFLSRQQQQQGTLVCCPMRETRTNA